MQAVGARKRSQHHHLVLLTHLGQSPELQVEGVRGGLAVRGQRQQLSERAPVEPVDGQRDVLDDPRLHHRDAGQRLDAPGR